MKLAQNSGPLFWCVCGKWRWSPDVIERLVLFVFVSKRLQVPTLLPTTALRTKFWVSNFQQNSLFGASAIWS